MHNTGPPGIGKTSAAVLVAKELGFDVMELNASDTRNKAGLEVRGGVCVQQCASTR